MTATRAQRIEGEPAPGVVAPDPDPYLRTAGDDPFRACAIIPCYDNPRTIRAVVEAVAPHVVRVIVVDDGSHAETRAEIDALAAAGLADVVHRAVNGGKGAAMKDGFRRAAALGFTHALQIDADGQHEVRDVPAALEAARAQPEALVVGAPVFDDSIPKARLWGRQLSVFWVAVETGGRFRGDPLCGFRVYPVAAALAAGSVGDRMDFDAEIAVRMVWAGAAVSTVPVRVRYLRPEEGGVSHFRMVRDNALIAWMHTRLCASASARALGLLPKATP